MGAIIIVIFQVNKLRDRMVKYSVLGHTANTQIQRLNSNLSDSRASPVASVFLPHIRDWGQLIPVCGEISGERCEEGEKV